MYQNQENSTIVKGKTCSAVILLLFMLTALPPYAAGQTTVTEEWVAIYSGPGNNRDHARAMAVDILGNVYVTGQINSGSSSADYATIKYDTGGNELWVAKYNGPGNSDDDACAMSVDTSGNVYVTGWSIGSSTHRDYATIKYDTNGNELWEARYNGPANSSDWAYAIAVDSSGNVYVTGESWGIGTDRDYATIKYDTNGNQLWVARYNGPGNSSDSAYSMAVDTSGNVYVTGSSYGSGTSTDYATIKYDTDGNELWVARYNRLGNSLDSAEDMALDASGNVYVLGKTYDFPNRYYVTIKYDTDGNQLWEAIYIGPTNYGDYLNVPKAITTDTLGNVYVTGESYDQNNNNDSFYCTIKYDTNGNELWVAMYATWPNFNYGGRAIAVNTSGYVYVTGGSAGDYATIKYDSFGNQIWVAKYNGPGSGYSNDYASAIVLDASGNVYITGTIVGSGETYNYNYATIKYSVVEPPEAVENLVGIVISLNLQEGISNSLDAKLASALSALDDINENNDVSAINSLYAFINAVQAQSGNKITVEEAAALIADAQEIIDLLTGT